MSILAAQLINYFYALTCCLHSLQIAKKAERNKNSKNQNCHHEKKDAAVALLEKVWSYVSRIIILSPHFLFTKHN